MCGTKELIVPHICILGVPSTVNDYSAIAVLSVLISTSVLRVAQFRDATLSTLSTVILVPGVLSVLSILLVISVLSVLGVSTVVPRNL